MLIPDVLHVFKIYCVAYYIVNLYIKKILMKIQCPGIQCSVTGSGTFYKR